MRQLRKANARGLSEIVGTLMLVLIVVGAAVAFSAFVASYQKQVQAEEQVAHNRALEDFRVLGMNLTLNATTPTTVAILNVTLANLDIQNSTITGISINGNPVRTYSAYLIDPETGSAAVVAVPSGFELNVTPETQAWIQINLMIGSRGYSMFSPSVVLSVTDHVKVNVYTALVNDFVQTFVPPTAVAFVSSIQSWNGVSYVNDPVLDGSQSLQSGNATLITWTWTVTDHNSTLIGPPVTTVYGGEKVALANTYAPENLYFANLTLTNSDGLVGFGSVPPFR
jgi:flagellin-like protein